MIKSEPSQRWFATWRRALPAAHEDAADLGTAFGMEISLLEQALDAQPPVARVSKPGWVNRLVALRKPAV
jgi:hypothetical protein